MWWACPYSNIEKNALNVLLGCFPCSLLSFRQTGNCRALEGVRVNSTDVKKLEKNLVAKRSAGEKFGTFEIPNPSSPGRGTFRIDETKLSQTAPQKQTLNLLTRAHRYSKKKTSRITPHDAHGLIKIDLIRPFGWKLGATACGGQPGRPL